MNYLDSRTRSKLAWLGAMLAPIVGVQAVRFVTSSDVSTAAAATAQSAAPAPAATKPLTAQQKAAIHWLMEQGAKPPKRSPMDFVDAPSAVAAQPADPGSPSTPQPVEVPDDRPKDLHITALIGDGARSLATINHKVRRVGDEIAPGWRIFKIDSHNRKIVIRHTDGRTMTISPDRPSE